jgi:hypothetical protein
MGLMRIKGCRSRKAVDKPSDLIYEGWAVHVVGLESFDIEVI